MLSIVVVEDFDLLREELVHYLSRDGWQVTGVGDGAALDQHLAQHATDVAVLDLNLPDEDGLSIAQRLRQRWPQLAIVMLTARDAPAHRAKGFMAGADVYLTKPAQVGEIEAVIRNVERRLHSAGGSSPEHAAHDKAEAKPMVLDLTRCELLLLPQQRLQLSPAEAQLLAALAQQHPHPVDLSTPLDAASLRVRISRLRAKWHSAGGEGELIEAVRGVGYRLTASVLIR